MLIAAWSNKQLGDDRKWFDNHPSNTMQSCYSTDGGRTWSAQTAASGPGSINAAFLHDPRSGDLLLVYNANRSEIQDDTSIAYRKSGDNGKTWGAATALDTGFPVDIMVHSGIVTSNGEWLIPFHYDRSGQASPFTVTRADFVAAVVASQDRGKTWSRFGAVEVPNLWRVPNGSNWAVEPGVAETRDGLLVMILRTRAGFLYRAESSDKGRTWSKAEPLLFSNPDSKHTVVGLHNGHLMLLWNNTQANQTRYPLMASLSSDGGRTWPRTITVDDDNVQTDYPAAIEVDGEVKAVYGHKLEEVSLVNLKESDFAARWTAINKGDAWRVKDGILRMADDGAVENTRDWLRWSKLIAFRYRRSVRYTVSADFRFDAVGKADAAVGIFPAYQDEANWAAWIWQPGTGHAGLAREQHYGRPKQGRWRDDSQAWLERVEPETGKWYRVMLRRDGRNLAWELTDKATGRRLAADTVEMEVPGCFPALGSRGVKVSFDNFVMADE